jgi:hypothetical protein
MYHAFPSSNAMRCHSTIMFLQKNYWGRRCIKLYYIILYVTHINSLQQRRVEKRIYQLMFSPPLMFNCMRTFNARLIQ